jgi:hypothetical protein
MFNPSHRLHRYFLNKRREAEQIEERNQGEIGLGQCARLGC